MPELLTHCANRSGLWESFLLPRGVRFDQPQDWKLNSGSHFTPITPTIISTCQANCLLPLCCFIVVITGILQHCEERAPTTLFPMAKAKNPQRHVFLFTKHLIITHRNVRKPTDIYKIVKASKIQGTPTQGGASDHKQRVASRAK